MFLSCAPRRAIRHTLHSRALSTSTLVPNHQIYISKSTDPYVNLSLEDWLFRHAPKELPLLLLYQDEPSVVLGRHQNPWRELSPRALREAGIPLVRRRSGGGAVYHDMGNTNFSIHLPRVSFDRHATAQVPLRALHSFGIKSALVNKRGDIVVRPPAHPYASSTPKTSPVKSTDTVPKNSNDADDNEDDTRDLKVSGSAYKITSGRAYHHGTMLISSSLSSLGGLLRAGDGAGNIVGKGVESVRSKVGNLAEMDWIWSGEKGKARIDHEIFTEAVVKSFKETYDVRGEPRVMEREQAMDIAFVQDGIEDLKGWDWAFGQTPEFKYPVKRTFDWGEVGAEIHSKGGMIISCSLKGAGADNFQELADAMKDRRYAYVREDADEDLLAGKDEKSVRRMKEVWAWLAREMDS